MVYLVDTENVANAWMSLLGQLKENDRLVLFYTKKSSKFSFDEMIQINKYADRIRFIRCGNGTPNALDFQLSAMTGYLYHSFPDEEYILIASDTGYDAMVSFMRSRGQRIKRISEQDLLTTDEPVVVSLNTPYSKELMASLLGLSTDDSQLVTIYKKYHHCRGQKEKDPRWANTFHNWLQNAVGTEKRTIYYQKLKGAGFFAK